MASTIISTWLRRNDTTALVNIARFARFPRQLAGYKTSAAPNLHPRHGEMLPRRSFILIAVLLASDWQAKT